MANGGMSDDSFEYFRTWIVMQGPKVFESVAKDPDSLAKFESVANFEGPQYAAGDVYKELTGDYQPIVSKSPEGSLGEEWDFDDDDEMRTRYPRLTEKYF